MGTLFVVATPIGNLEDVTPRALRVLREVGLVAAEDTRTTRKLLSAFAIHTPLVSYFEHNKLARLDYIAGRLAESDVAIVSEAGTPGINDPGYELITRAIARGFPVVPVPGASAVITALSVSGLPADQFVYLGFLPRRAGERCRLLEGVAAETRTLVCFEAPHRVQESLQDLLTVLGDRQVAVCRELTKLHEEVFRGRLGEALARSARPSRGEFTIVVAGAAGRAQASEDEARAVLLRLREDGVSSREAMDRVVRDTGLPRRTVYRLWVAVAGPGGGDDGGP